MVNRWVAFAVAVAAPAIALAQGKVIGGGVYEDRPALALRNGFTPLAGVGVKLYRDGVLVASTTTKKDGLYAFRGNQDGTYQVAVDSRTMHSGGAWAEQTFGPAGSLCARPEGATVTIQAEGPCFGGRSGNADDASALATSEHVAAVTLGGPVSSLDFAFSFDAVTSTSGDKTQGSFRQFVDNANALPGPNRMRFVPLTRAPEQRDPTMGVPPRWWTITLGGQLPALSDADTVIDGTAYSFVAPSSVANIHPGRIGEAPAIKPEDMKPSRQQKPELELVVTGSEGIACGARCGLRALSLRGTAIGIALRADARVEHVMIGVSPDALPAPSRGTVGLQIERGLTIARHVTVSSQSNVGIAVGPDGRLDGDHLDVSRCGEPLSGAGVALLSNGSTIRSSNIAANPGAGIVVGAIDGSRAVSGNTIDGSTISSNQAGVVLSPGASRNVVSRNDLMWNRLGGVTVAPFDKAAPTENRLSANRYDENGVRPIVLNLAADPNSLARAGTCERVAGAANTGISAPVISNAQLTSDAGGHRVTIRGRACPGQVVEVYQSYATSSVRERALDMPRIRANEEESVTNQSRQLSLPSIGEFNYLGAATTSADGTFEATFPFAVVSPTEVDSEDADSATDVWAREVLEGAEPTERAFSAIAIDPAGNTSEMGVRRQIDRQVADR